MLHAKNTLKWKEDFKGKKINFYLSGLGPCGPTPGGIPLPIPGCGPGGPCGPLPPGGPMGPPGWDGGPGGPLISLPYGIKIKKWFPEVPIQRDRMIFQKHLKVFQNISSREYYVPEVGVHRPVVVHEARPFSYCWVQDLGLHEVHPYPYPAQVLADRSLQNALWLQHSLFLLKWW